MLKRRLEDLTEPDLREYMISCGRALKTVASLHGLNEPLFALILFNDPAVGQYIGNCERPDMIRALRETADRLEKREDVPR